MSRDRGPAMSEDDLLRGVIDLARCTGYRVCHFRPGRTAWGWRTPIMGDPGFPDVAIAGHGRCIVAELKSSSGTVDPDQAAWHAALVEAGVEAYVWRPEHWESGEIRQILEARRRPDRGATGGSGG